MNGKHTFLLGVIVKAQGIKGEVKVKPYTDTPDDLCHLTQIIVDDSILHIEKIRTDYSMAYFKIEGVDDRDAADAFKNKEIYVDKKDAPKLPKGRYYIEDLMGCKMYDDDKEFLGELINVLQNGANDIYVIKNSKGEILVPVLKSVIKSIDIDKKEIILIKERLMEVALYEY